MATRTLNNASSRRQTHTWKDIDQSVKPKAMSAVSERRVWVGRAKAIGLGLAIVGVVVAALRFSSLWERGPELLTQAGESLPIREVEIETDGSLNRVWLLKQLELDAEANLLSVDIVALKSKLERIGQVESAEVERRFPDTLAIAVTERQPILRLLARRANGQKLLLFVDAKGVVFEGDQIDPAVARYLPFIDGVALKRQGSGFAPLTGIGPAVKLLHEAKTLAPHLYRTWRVVSLEKAPEIIIKSKTAKVIKFTGDKEFGPQLGRLDYILDHYPADLSQQLAQVDLTLSDQVPVKSARIAR